MYVLRIEIDLVPHRAVDDPAARQQALAIFRETVGSTDLIGEGLRVKLQDRSPDKQPRPVRFP